MPLILELSWAQNPDHVIIIIVVIIKVYWNLAIIPPFLQEKPLYVARSKHIKDISSKHQDIKDISSKCQDVKDISSKRQDIISSKSLTQYEDSKDDNDNL